MTSTEAFNFNGREAANNRLLSKLAAGDEEQGVAARSRGVYKGILDEASADTTQLFASGVEFRKKSNIILIGFMGSGKSAIGKQVAKRLGYDYLDTDELIVSKARKSIASIFETEGEARFRELEAEVLHDLSLSSKKKILLLTGGGIILSEKNRQLLKSLGTIIWLHASTDVLFERATRQSKRPLLEVEYPRRTFNELLLKRLPLYRELCDIEMDTTQLSYSQTVEKLLAELLSA